MRWIFTNVPDYINQITCEHKTADHSFNLLMFINNKKETAISSKMYLKNTAILTF